MILFLGDIHGVTNYLINAVDKAKAIPEVTAIIQVGDFGFYPRFMRYYEAIHPHVPVYVIDGNHEHFPMLKDWKEVTEFASNLFYVPRGTVLEIDGRTIGFLGGGYSIDKKYRLKHNPPTWFPEENITDSDTEKFSDVNDVDILVTHVPPIFMIRKYFDQNILRSFGLPIGWEDQNMIEVQKVWDMLGCPKLYCGHMHRSMYDRGVRILDIGETFCD